jgi:nitrogen regulatory protein PII
MIVQKGSFECRSCDEVPSDQHLDTYEVVVKYSGKLYKGSNGTGIHELFQGLQMPNGPVITFAIINDESKPAYTPDQKVEVALKAFNAGDVIDLICIPSKARGGAPLISSQYIPTAYTVRTGETDKNGWVFEEQFTHKEKQRDVQVVTLSRFKQKSMFLIPTHPDPANPGDMLPDEIIMGIIGKLKPQDVVYVQAGTGNNPTIKMLAPWANHATGKFAQFDTDKPVDANNNTGPAVEVTDASGKTVTALIPGSMNGKKWVADGTVVGQARRLKADAEVDYLTADSGDGRIWLVSIAAAKPEKPGITRNTGGGGAQ